MKRSRTLRVFGGLALTAAWLSVTGVSARAATPQGTEWTYQGRLKQGGGVVVNDTCACHISLPPAPTSSSSEPAAAWA